jgi:hypothetical protein
MIGGINPADLLQEVCLCSEINESGRCVFEDHSQWDYFVLENTIIVKLNASSISTSIESHEANSKQSLKKENELDSMNCFTLPSDEEGIIKPMIGNHRCISRGYFN